MFNLAQNWIAYIYIGLFIGFWIYIIIKGRKPYENEYKNEMKGKEDTSSEKRLN